jgi:hypothetical protein
MKTTVWLVAATVGLAGCSTLEIQGHRGARGLAPENTLAAFERASTRAWIPSSSTWASRRTAGSS